MAGPRARPQRLEKPLDFQGLLHLVTFPRYIPKRVEMCPYGSKYYRPSRPSSWEELTGGVKGRPSAVACPSTLPARLELPDDEVHRADQVAPAVADLPAVVPVPVDDHALDAELVHPLLQGDAEARVVHHQVQVGLVRDLLV